MRIDFLTQQLNNLENPKRENRQKVANLIIKDTDLLADLITITFDVTNKTSIKAAWILEWICNHHNLNLLIPYLQNFTDKITSVTFDSAIRPCAKICELLAITYTEKTTNLIQQKLTKSQIDKIIEASFDWLITPQKIAVKAYSMQTLFLFGLQEKWIHPELANIIRTKVIHQSKGCEARGKRILHLIEKQSKIIQ